MNKVTLIGRLGQDPETTFTGEKAKCSFSVATSKKWNDRDGNKQEKTEWHKIEFWNKKAEICQRYLHKGSQVAIEGEIQYQSWDNKQTGAKMYKTVIIGNDIEFLGNKSDVQNTSNNQGEFSPPNLEPRPYADPAPTFTTDDIPF